MVEIYFNNIKRMEEVYMRRFVVCLREKCAMLLSVILIVSVLSTVVPTSVLAAVWKTGNLVNYNQECGYTLVCFDNLKKDAYVKIYAYKSNGKEIKLKDTMHVIMRTTSGKWICEFDTKSGSKLRLGNDHTAYRIYIKRTFTETYNPKEKNRAKYWGLKTYKNCRIY